ncbi:MAG: aspartate kinase [Microscillaceae bacterium]|jgi:aspartate kinase|nr:aspartate kinase [Microscillaceae bacterium]
MRVFKFGGASLKDSWGIQNMINLVKQQNLSNELLIVVSAMGKTTNALEELLKKYWQKADYQANIQAFKAYHYGVMKDGFPDEDDEVYALIDDCVIDLQNELVELKNESDFDKVYDQIVSFGEILSSRLVHYALNQAGVVCEWIDARWAIRTDHTWREGRVDWEITNQNIQSELSAILAHKIILTQGFIGGTEKGDTTTLGREGSDFSGAVFASALQAQSLTIWKDVPGVLNADPKRLSNAELFTQLSYREASEMTYYGASVIHPKTIAPLKRANIPLLVRSFLEPHKTGTCISEATSEQNLAAIIHKNQQVLIHLETIKFNYLREEEVAEVLVACAEVNLKVNLLHKSAFELTICTDNRPERIDRLIDRLSEDFYNKIEPDFELITLLNANSTLIGQITGGQSPALLEHRGNLYQLVLPLSKNKS